MTETTYAYLDAEGYVKQWSRATRPPVVDGLTLHQLLPGEPIRPFQRMIAGGLVSYEPDVPLDDVKAGAVDDANAARDRRRATFDRFNFEGVEYDGDARAEASIMLAARRAVQPDATAVLWRARDNADHLLTPAQVVALEVALIAAKSSHANALHQACCAYKRSIAAAQTIAEIRALEATA